MNSTFGISVLDTINEYRHEFFLDSHREEEQTFDEVTEQVFSWFCHKVFTVISLSANTLALAESLAGAGFCACTIGVAKIAIFALTLGHVELESPTGVLWFGSRAFISLGNIQKNITELAVDAALLSQTALIQCYYAIEKMVYGAAWVLQALRMERMASLMFEYAMTALGTVIDFVQRALFLLAERINEGVQKVSDDEAVLPDVPQHDIPGPIGELNRLAFHAMQEVNRGSLEKLGELFLFSSIGIPLNAAVIPLSLGACTAAVVVSSAKVALYTFTNIHIGVPTGVVHTFTISYMGLRDFFGNSAALLMGIVHVVALVHKVGSDWAERLGITVVLESMIRALHNIGVFICYIPRAVFS